MRARVFSISLVVSLLFIGQVLGQGLQISGRVIAGDDRSPLLGLNVQVKGSERGTATDMDGRYVLENVSASDVLIFTYIGYQRTEVTVGSREVIDLVMTPEAISGEEVVVTGYGTQLRKNVTSSIASLDEHAFNKGATNDPQTLLQARIPGVNISTSSGELGGEPLIRIRGGTSISASNQPLIVIDGIPVSNDSRTPSVDTGDQDVIGGSTDNILSTLNPYDIASIDVLKDASAAAIYGARGGNGVILITTKQGVAGGISVNYDGYTTTASMGKDLDLLSAQEYRDFAQQVDAPTGNLGTSDTDWQDAATRTALSQSHNVSFSSGTENTQYRVSMNYLDEESIIRGSERQRITGRLNVNHKALDGKLRLAVRINPTFVKRDNVPFQQDGGFQGGVVANILKMNPTDPVRNSDGSFFVNAGDPVGIRNPVALSALVQDEQKTQRLLVNATAEYQLTSQLSAKVNGGLDRSTIERRTFEPNAIPYAAAFGGAATQAEAVQRTSTLETTLNYRTDISDSQTLEAWAGYTFQEFEFNEFAAQARGFVTDAFSFNNLEGGSNFSNRPTSKQEESRLVSFLGRANYSLGNGKYLLSAALRREGSSRFGEGKKWGSFPSASVGWRVSDEDFFNGLAGLDDLKLRLSWGITGNQDIGNFKSLVLLGPGANAVIGSQTLTGIGLTQVANPDLQWEETTQLNLGIDFGLKNNRISGSLDLYSKRTDKLLLEFGVPQPAPVPTRLANAGEVTNKGIELSLNTINVSSGDFFWRTNFNFASNKSDVDNLGARDFIVHSRVSGAGLSDLDALILLPGEPVGTFFGPRFLGFDGDGNEILSTDPDRPESSTGPLGDGRQILGDSQPDFTIGFSNSINYKSWDFGVYVQGVFGFDLLNNTELEYRRPSNVFNGINLFAGAVQDVADGLGTNATVAYSDRFIQDGTYVRLQNATIGYTFGSEWIRDLRVRNLRLYVSADNLFVLTGYDGFDPEVNTFVANAGTAEGVGSVPSIGIDYTNLPRARSFSFGLNVGL